MAGTNPYASIVTSPSPAPPAPALDHNPYAEILNPKHVDRAIDNSVGKAIVKGHENPFTTFEGFMEASQRGLEAAVTGGDIGKAITHPEERESLQKAFRSRIGLQQQEDPGGVLAGEDLPHKLARAGVNIATDIATDPVSYAPVGKLFEAIGKGVPLVGDAARAIGEWAEKSPIGRVLDPEHELAGATVQTKALVNSALHKSEHASRVEMATKEAAVRSAAPTIRATGDIPSQIKALFYDPAKIPAAHPGLSPKDVISALHEDRRPITRAAYDAELDKAGLKKTPGFYTGSATGSQFFKPETLADPNKLSETLESIRNFGSKKPPTDNGLLRLGQALTHLGNQMFLAIPFPHGGNLTDLSYMNYGIMNTIAGLGRALEVSRGKPSASTQHYIGELEKFGGDSKYQNIFSELGFDKLFGSQKLAEAANKAVIPAQRLSNYAQNKFLNPLETGLRAQAYKHLEGKGLSGEEAVRDIDRSFGSDEPNALSRWSSELGTPFAKFHGQTAIGQGLRGLVTNPARVNNPVKADLDYNESVNPGRSPKFRTSIPGMSTARAIADSTHYWTTLAGPLSGLQAYYSSLSQTQKGKVAEALSVVFHRYVPVDQVVQMLGELISRSKGQGGETGIQDIGPAIVGGYYHKADKSGE